MNGHMRGDARKRTQPTATPTTLDNRLIDEMARAMARLALEERNFHLMPAVRKHWTALAEAALTAQREYFNAANIADTLNGTGDRP